MISFDGFIDFSRLRLDFVLGVRREEEDEGGVRWRRKTVDTTVEERDKVLKDIDPEVL